MTLATFATYTLTGGILDAGTAFTALSLFNILRFPMNMLPTMINYLVTVGTLSLLLPERLTSGHEDTLGKSVELPLYSSVY